MFHLEAYGVNSLGTEATARKIEGETLWKTYQDMLKKAPLYLYYCGSAEPDRVEAAFRSAFASLPKEERQGIPDTFVFPDAVGSVRRFSDAMDVTQGKLALGFRTGGAFGFSEESGSRSGTMTAFPRNRTSPAAFVKRSTLCSGSVTRYPSRSNASTMILRDAVEVSFIMPYVVRVSSPSSRSRSALPPRRT